MYKLNILCQYFLVSCHSPPLSLVSMFAVTAESRKLMDQILASEADNAEVSSRVAALLAGSNLTTKQGVRRVNDGVQYDEGESSRSFCLLPSIVSGPILLLNFMEKLSSQGFTIFTFQSMFGQLDIM